MFDVFVSHPELSGPTGLPTSVVVSPLYHAYAFCMYVTGCMAHGAKLVVVESFKEEDLLKAIEMHRVGKFGIECWLIH